MNEQIRGLESLLDSTRARLMDGDIWPAMEDLIAGLRELRPLATTDYWNEGLRPACLRHSLRELLHQDPYTRRAFEKPRGYAGDAAMLDYIYLRAVPPGTSPLGEQLFSCTTRSGNALSVLSRRDLLASLIDRTAEVVQRPRILSVACGHLREAERSQALRAGLVGTYFALDQDYESIAVVEREQSDFGVIPVHASVKSLLCGATSFSNMDLIYAAGLYDYLPDDKATSLTRVLFDMLAPGGRLVLANFVPDNSGRGYMESFMDWALIYRDGEALEELASTIPTCMLSGRQMYHDSHGNIVYLDCCRAA